MNGKKRGKKNHKNHRFSDEQDRGDISTKKYMAGIILGIVGVVVVIYIVFAYTGHDRIFTTTTTLPSNTSGFEKFEEYSIQGKLRRQYQPDRSKYGRGRIWVRDEQRYYYFDMSEIFSELPPIPKDFWRYRYQLMRGDIAMETLANLTSDYYEQPEWIRDNFYRESEPDSYGTCREGILDEERNVCIAGGIVNWKEPDIYHWTPEGYGTYPNIMGNVLKQGESDDLYTFFHTSWKVETYQGFSLVPRYYTTITGFENVKYVDPETAKKYINITLDPNVVLMSPTYPKFIPGWSKKIRMHIDVADDAPPGKYAVGFDVAKAPKVNETIWSMQYHELYQSKSGFGITTPQFQVLLEVVPK